MTVYNQETADPFLPKCYLSITDFFPGLHLWMVVVLEIFFICGELVTGLSKLPSPQLQTRAYSELDEALTYNLWNQWSS